MNREISLHICAADKEQMLEALSRAAKEIMEECDECPDCNMPFMKEDPKIIEHTQWFADEIRNFCLEEGYFTEGKIREYEEMLLFVDRNDPTPMNIYRVAKNILAHSDQEHQRGIEYMMRDISVDLVNRHYEVK